MPVSIPRMHKGATETQRHRGGREVRTVPCSAAAQKNVIRCGARRSIHASVPLWLPLYGSGLKRARFAARVIPMERQRLRDLEVATRVATPRSLVGKPPRDDNSG